MILATFLQHYETIADAMFRLATDGLLQSTLLIALGLLLGRMLRARGAAVQSMVYRMTLAAALACPLVSLLLSGAGVPGLHVNLPVPATSSGRFQADTYAGPAGALVADPPVGGFQGPAAPSLSLSSEGQRFPSAWGVAPPHAAAAETEIWEVVPSPDWPSAVACMVAAVWLLGTGLLAIRLWMAWRLAAHLRRSASPSDPQTTSDCAAPAKRLGVRPPPVLRSPFATSPSLVGWFRPAILLPDAGIAASNREILVHELAHLARGDQAWRFLAHVGAAVLFFQPLIWLLARRIAISAEEVCDDYVLDFGFDRPSYARELVEVAQRYQPAAAVGVGMISLRSCVGRRVLRILDSSRQLSLRAGRRAVGLALGIVLATTILAGLVGMAWDQAGAAPALTPTPPTPNDSPAAVSRPGDRFELRGHVVDPDGKPLPGANVYFVFYTNCTHAPLPPPKLRATTGHDGRFHFALETSEFDTWRSSHPWGILDDVDYKNDCRLVAQAPGYGLVWRPAFAFDESGRLRNRILQDHPDDREAVATKLEPVLRVVKDVPLVGRIVDPQGRPVGGVEIRVMGIEPVKNEDLTGWLSAAEKKGADVASTMAYYSRKQLPSGSFTDDFFFAEVLPQVMPKATSGADGRFRLTGIGRERIAALSIEGPGIETACSIAARTRPGSTLVLPYSLPRMTFTSTFYGATFEHVARPSVPIVGTVRDKDTGKPLPGVTVQAHKLAGNPAPDFLVSMYFHNTTDDRGRYRLSGMPIGEDNELLAMPAKDQPYLLSKKTAGTAAGKGPGQVDFELKRGVWIRGRVTDAKTGRPVARCAVEYFAFLSNPNSKAAPGFKGAYRYLSYQTDKDGRYTLPGLPGRGIVALMALDDGQTRYPLHAGMEKIPELRDARGAFAKVVPAELHLERINALAEVNPAEGAQGIQLDFQLDPGKTLTGTVLDPARKPLAGAHVSGLTEQGPWNLLSADSFTINAYRPDKPRKLLFVHLQRKLAGTLVVAGAQATPLRVRLQPWGAVAGRVVDANGKPMGSIEIRADDLPRYLQVKGPDGEFRRVRESDGTGPDGRFRIEGLAPGAKYTFSAWDLPRGKYFGKLISDVSIEPGETKDLGDLKTEFPAAHNPAFWSINLKLDTPGLEPLAVQYAILDNDPVPGFLAEVRRMRSYYRKQIAAAPDEDKKELQRSISMTVSWDRGFKQITGDNLYLLSTDGNPGFGSNRPEGQKWVVSKIVQIGGKPACWCIPVRVKTGQLVKVTLTEANLFDLSSAFDKAMQDSGPGR